MPIYPITICPRTKSLSNLGRMQSRLCGNHMWWTDFLHSKFYRIVWTCNCATPGPFAHSPPVGVSMGENLVYEIAGRIKLSRLVVVQRQGRLPNCSPWQSPWAEKFYLWNCWMDFLRIFMELSRYLVIQRQGYLPICPLWACPWAQNMIYATDGQIIIVKSLWNCLHM